MSWQSEKRSLSRLDTTEKERAGDAIDPSPQYLYHLRYFRNEMRDKPGVRIELLSDEELISRVKCQQCGSRCSKRNRNFNKQGEKIKNGNCLAAKDAQGVSGQGLQDAGIAGPDAVGEKQPKEPLMRCRFHPGRVANKHWTCCGLYGSQPGCQQRENHVPDPINLPQLRARFQYVPTYQAIAKATRHRRVAVAIDCEMGTSRDFEPEVIRLTLIDYFTSEVLIDSLVWPDIPILHYNTKYSGVSRQQMFEARRARQCIMGLDRAREPVWKFVDEETVVIGHGLQSDFSAMRWLHHAIIDSLLIEQDIWQAEVRQVDGENKELAAAFEARKLEAENGGDVTDLGEKPEEKPRPKPNLSLKDAAENRLGKRVQEGNGGHDSLEDALTARDLVDWHIRRSMEAAIGAQEDLLVF